MGNEIKNSITLGTTMRLYKMLDLKTIIFF